MLNKGASINSEMLLNVSSLNVSSVSSSKEFTLTAFLIATAEGHSDIMEALIDKGADVNGEVKDTRLPLSLAIIYGHVEAVKVLIKRGVDVNAKDGVITNVELAKEKGHDSIVKLLKDAGAKE